MSLSLVVEYAKSKIGCGYVRGATGWICNEKRREQQAKQYPQHAETILEICAKWDGKQCFDCAQLTRYAVRAAGGDLPSGATSQYKNGPWVRKGLIADMPDVPGLILYREDGGVMQHTGVYIGGGDVVDSRGSSSGVIRSRLSSYKWSHWAEPVVPVGNAAGTNTPEKGESSMYEKYTVKASGGLRMRETPSVKGKYMRMIPDGSALYVTEIKDGFGRVEYAGHIGYVSMDFLVDGNGDRAGKPTLEESELSAPTANGDYITVSRSRLAEIYAIIGGMLNGGVD